MRGSFTLSTGGGTVLPPGAVMPQVTLHTCRHCGDGFPSYPVLRQHLDSHLLPPKVCPTCKRPFTRTADLRRHSSRCRPKPFVCDVCHSSFGRRGDLARHERTIQCGGPKEPESAPKPRKIVEYLHEDTATAPDADHWTTSFPSITRSHSR